MKQPPPTLQTSRNWILSWSRPLRFFSLLLTICLNVTFMVTAGCKPPAGGALAQTSPNSNNGASSSPGRAALVSWQANRESAVNSPGGGYRVYYSQTSGIQSSTPFVDVPSQTGVTTPTTARLSGLSAGTYFIYVVAYSAKNSTGSNPSSEQKLEIK